MHERFFFWWEETKKKLLGGRGSYSYLKFAMIAQVGTHTTRLPERYILLVPCEFPL